MARRRALAGLSRSGSYYRPRSESGENLELMRLLDEQCTRTPFNGARRMTHWLGEHGWRGVQEIARETGKVLGDSVANGRGRQPEGLPAPRRGGFSCRRAGRAYNFVGEDGKTEILGAIA